MGKSLNRLLYLLSYHIEKYKFINGEISSYSQFYEDFILISVFHNVKEGFYIDIGANDPNIISVTKSFYLSGWNGINIELLPDKYDLL